ncbi:hypothetical protein O6H91_03G063000 [Diphasiastrum complanatum]|uniref:Uncharacterized protein n=1 Tax=Diphasiastrum complanatum TaxID=34168 RepID=A0ACC2E7F9_DIPCM|nr:hypothetical protein O6H91_Y423400 [Diphasiastrum complanatum]KAJ7562300.1 hypothetical protein O6H91_03G063000 [Diphasiastrum complanatum]
MAAHCCSCSPSAPTAAKLFCYSASSQLLNHQISSSSYALPCGRIRPLERSSCERLAFCLAEGRSSKLGFSNPSLTAVRCEVGVSEPVLGDSQESLREGLSIFGQKSPRNASQEEDEGFNPMGGWMGEADSWREECGVVGIFGDEEASKLCYLALHALQHRGQEGAGIVTSDGGSMKAITGVGLVSEVFNQEKLGKLAGSSAIGHVRYATAGESALRNVQPFVAGYRFGSVAVAHNGNLVNYKELRARLEENGSIFNTSSDTEVVLHLIATSKARPFISRLVHACEQLEGAYSLVFLTEDKLVAVRDPYGFRPLVMGWRKNGALVFASETCALDLIEAEFEREVNPGEVVVMDKDGISSLCVMHRRQRKACIFEHIYFALPNSVVFGRSVYESRYRIGQILAEESPVDCDVVIAVPDSGMVAALGYAAKAGVPFQQGLIRSHYVGRTFIEPSQKIRDFGVKLKLAPVHHVLKGKRVVVVDDSIVRGTTSSKIVRLIKQAGATEVHMRIASPPITGSCYYGVDTPRKEELLSYRLNVEESREFIGADSLAFLPLERLRSMLGEEAPTFCDACFSVFAMHRPIVR